MVEKRPPAKKLPAAEPIVKAANQAAQPALSLKPSLPPAPIEITQPKTPLTVQASPGVILNPTFLHEMIKKESMELTPSSPPPPAPHAIQAPVAMPAGVNPSRRPTLEMIRDVGLLQVFSEIELLQLLSMGVGVTAEAHTNLVVEAELSWGLYLILDGRIGIYKTNAGSGENHDIAHLREGEYFGEMSLIDDRARAASAKALTDCYLFYISKQVFHEFLEHAPGLKTRFLESCIGDLVRRIRVLDDNFMTCQSQLWRLALGKEAA